ncbi:FAD-dependent oxidoreductase [Paraburkholderia sp. J76]|uniref:FAD-dependent oxidoreductase n=1 Tax=Paraburkholderia sp. J76 TaxID=2805439 RepID=UPI0039F5B5B5
MHNHHSHLYDVVIAGAGPVGLFLACELRLRDLPVLVLERAQAPHSPLKRLAFGMRGLSAPTLEALYRRGLLDEVIAMQRADDSAREAVVPAHWMQHCPWRRTGRSARQLFARTASGGSKRSRLVAHAGRAHAAHPEHARPRSDCPGSHRDTGWRDVFC